MRGLGKLFRGTFLSFSGRSALNDSWRFGLTEFEPQQLPDIQKVNEAYERLLKANVKYRFAIDMASLKSE